MLMKQKFSSPLKEIVTLWTKGALLQLQLNKKEENQINK